MSLAAGLPVITVTVAFGTGAPLPSMTMPVIDGDCPATARVIASARMTVRTQTLVIAVLEGYAFRNVPLRRLTYTFFFSAAAGTGAGSGRSEL